MIYCHQERLGIGVLVAQLELVAKAFEPCNLAERIFYLPRWSSFGVLWRFANPSPITTERKGRAGASGP